MIADHTDTRPLDILGVQVVGLDEALGSRVRSPLPQTIAIDAELYAADARVRDGMLDVFDHMLIDEVTLWGDGCPSEIDRRVAPVQHRLSMAARAFKLRALSAVAATVDTAEPTEQFRSCALNPGGDGFGDLVPAAR